jgi:ABC-type dipeptide/oligopeptide/nickel transport system ATPase subunit
LAGGLFIAIFPKQELLMAETLLSVKDVSKVYVSRRLGLFGKKEERSVLRQVNLEMRTGEILGLTGNSGCGKTTLARCILGLVNYEGEITINGQNKKHDQIQMVFQDPGDSLNPAKRIGWLMEEPMVIRRIGTREERQKRADEMLLKVGLDASYRTRRVHEISGGQKQRVCIGRALMLAPKLLIADEAVSSLDVSTGAQILNLFRELHGSLGLGILFISHNVGAAEYLCDRITVMRDGKVT